jgi:hypothetical protein
MGLWSWIRSYFSTNGFDSKKHETEVRKLKDETLVNWDKASGHIDKIKGTFKEVEESFAPDDFPARPESPQREGPALLNEG